MDHYGLRPGIQAGMLAIMLGAALSIGGCSSKSSVESRSTTVGQELRDLEDARNKGLLTEEEYNKQRETILKRK